MGLSRGEKLALWCLLPFVVGLLPPVTGWAAAVQVRVLGLPFLLLWNSLMVVAASLSIAVAAVVRRRVDGQ